MKDTKVHCSALGCHWNIGVDVEDNCACVKIEISDNCICQRFVTREEAKRRIKIATVRG